MLSYFNQRISGDYLYSEKYFDPDHYFSKDIIHLNNKEIFVDCGAYTGDTIEDLLSRCMPQKIYAFEPDHANFKILSKKFKSTPSIICIPKGAYEQKDELHFSGNCADSSKLCNEGETIIPVDSIDNMTAGDKVSFIKMDIEGAELDALKGAKKTIKKFHPKLAISAYHKFEDLLEIPQFIQVIDHSYKFYLRRHSYLVHELVLYAL